MSNLASKNRLVVVSNKNHTQLGFIKEFTGGDYTHHVSVYAGKELNAYDIKAKNDDGIEPNTLYIAGPVKSYQEAVSWVMDIMDELDLREENKEWPFNK